MFKVRMFGAIDALATVLDFDSALAILFPAIGNPDASGDIIDCETGEVLVIVQDGEVDHIAPDTMVSMLDAIYEEDPEAAIALALMGLVAGL